MFRAAKIITLTLLPLLVFAFLAGNIFAHEGEVEPYEDVEEATLAPDSPFYFLRGWQEGIERFVANFRGDEAVADLEIRLAERRISEMRRLADLEVDGERMERLRERWEQHLERAEERAVVAGENREAIRERILEQMDRHRAVLERVREQASEEARDALDRAIENYETLRGYLLERFSEDQIEELREELRERLDSTVERFELNRERFQELRESRAVDIEIQENISYGTSLKQKLDLCKPVSIAGKTPGVILIHGGGGDKSSFRKPCVGFAKAGFVAISINYREEPPPSYKLMLPDVNSAIDWLKSKSYVQSNKIGAYGGSLGGYLSSVAGTFESNNKVQCVENNFGPTDFTDPNFEGTPHADEFVTKFFGGVTYEEDPALYQSLSPVFNLSSNDAYSWFFSRSKNDQLVPRTQMTIMIAALKKVGIKTEFYEYNGTGSGHANKLGLLQARRLYNKRLNFMKSCLNNL